jgi:hypothetical protein
VIPEILRTPLDRLAQHGEGSVILALEDRPESITVLAQF